MTRPVQQKTTSISSLDLNIVTNISLSPNQPVQTGFETSSTKVAGILKAANMFYKILFTKKGSNPLDSDEGTDFVDLYESSIADNEVLFSFVNTEVDSAFEQIQSYQEDAGVDDTEKIVAARIVNFSTDTETNELNVNIGLFVASGETTTLQIPSIVIT